ncbi:VirD4-like conjugal transfer protein, CD1115 family [Streptococcus suis]|uniref:Type IV secretory system conjugative DNA transfer family protein n=1 Tax=Streptococcus suis TaxID=1307 RepID=A0AAW5LS40_STRSU|nr:type IV secretory system conjugative DNA transfer family protein [Streptococcus suis]MCK4024108.1 type IV secretory system conjugative DNA transfer family protein [Streptococcus suis]MCK4051390.1 type IV secretory system conjugative DNA transfer family protein [Streptococcus suis]MCR1231931.1 type IV secretory system conjugative DNA transfer family protein [Streptococcus suis]MDG4509778.1 type IV secretory system conjugative DNA transfer family protein [Streptococcus suis]MDY7331667.1 type 
MSITKVERRKFWPYALIGVIVAYACHWFFRVYEHSPVADSITDPFGLTRLDWVSQNWSSFPWINLDFSENSMMAGFFGFLVVTLFYMHKQTPGVYRYGEEHGSARYATQEEIDSLKDEIEDNNMLFSQRSGMGLFNKRLPFDRQINKNVLVIGGTGDWKTRSFVKPNALQRNSSYIFTDTKGLLVHELGKSFEDDEYQIKVFDVITFMNSNRFNVFRYMRSELDIDRVAEAIVIATKKSDHSGEDFWIQAQTLLMRALIGYLYFDSSLSGYVASLPMMADLVRNLKEKDGAESVVTILFQELENELPGNYACKQWALFNELFNGETRNSVYALVAAIVSVFDHDDVRRLVEDDDMEIGTWNIKKTAVFINIPEVNPAYQFLTSLLFSTIFEVTFKTADDILLGRRSDVSYPLHLQIEGDEIAQVGKIPNLPPVISVIRSREISLKLMIQSLSQLQELYGEKNTKTILNNCGTVVYLGSNDSDTLKWLSERSGRMTINDRNVSENRGRNGSSTLQNAKLGRELLTPHEVATIAPDEALVFIAKHNVFRDKKFDLLKHQRAGELADSPQDKNWYRYVRHMSDIDEFLEGVKPSRNLIITEEDISKI